MIGGFARLTETYSISIIIPTHQRRDVVCQAVLALSACDYDGDVELIVVVDGSTDGTAAALSAINPPFPFRVLEQENFGAARARNRGAELSTHEILLFLDDDMIAAPDLLRQHALSHWRGAGAVLGHIPLDPKSPPGLLAQGVRRWSDERANRLKGGADLTLFDLLTGQLSVKRALFEDLGGFDETFTKGGQFGDEDLDFGVRLLERVNVVFNPDAVSYQRYVVTPRQLLRQWADAGRADLIFARKHPQHADKLYALHGANRLLHRLVLRPAAAIPGAAAIAAMAGIWIADRYESLPGTTRAIARRLFRISREMVYWTAVREEHANVIENKVLVLCYHAVSDLSADPVLAPYGIAKAEFAKQIDTLLKRGFRFISPDDFASFIAASAKVPAKSVLLTFDDCYEGLAEVARDILEPRGIRAIGFAVTGMASGTNEWTQKIGSRRLRLLSAAGLREMATHGLEVGCHSRTHPSMPTLSDHELRDETEGAAATLAEAGLPWPRFFAYPHGHHDNAVRNAVRNAGFVAAFALLPRNATPTSDRFAIPRIQILACDTGWRFYLKTTFPRLERLTRLRSIIAMRASRIATSARRAISPS